MKKSCRMSLGQYNSRRLRRGRRQIGPKEPPPTPPLLFLPTGIATPTMNETDALIVSSEVAVVSEADVRRAMGGMGLEEHSAVV